MAIDLTLLEETPDVATAATTTAGKQRFVFLRNSKSLTGFVIIAFFAVLAVIGPWIAPYDPSALSADLLQAAVDDALAGHQPAGAGHPVADHHRHPQRR